MTGAARAAVHGMPRIGAGRSLKLALEAFWAGKIPTEELQRIAAGIRQYNWQVLSDADIDFLPSNDFSLYDHVLDAAVMVGAVPDRFRPEAGSLDLDRYFAMARGGDIADHPAAPLELTKWFDTNYHHLVPEFGDTGPFAPDTSKLRAELAEASALGIAVTPVLLGPLTLLLRGSHPLGTGALHLLDPVVDAYGEVLAELARAGVSWVRIDEPCLVEDRDADELLGLQRAYRQLAERGDRPGLVISTYFGHVGSALPVLADLPVEGIGLDFCRGPENLDLLQAAGGLGAKLLMAGVVDGRNVWANDLYASLQLLDRLGEWSDEVVVSTSCSLLHVPLSLRTEPDLPGEVLPWLAFAEEKVGEVATLAKGLGLGREAVVEELDASRRVRLTRERSGWVVDDRVRQRAADVAGSDPRRSSGPEARAAAQRERLGLPLLPTTTIGSFPQTAELRSARAKWRAHHIDDQAYLGSLRDEVDRVIRTQEEIGLDVLVHGEPERDDMVRYFADQLTGYVLPVEGWVQSYGSRCVRPPVLTGDVSRPKTMTADWAGYAQSRTSKPVKGMLTGPVTMLRWSFVRDDQPESETALQLALAIRDELVDLQSAGIAVIQVDEPGLREGLPLRTGDHADYLAWATRAFRMVTEPAEPHTQVHTHMCYAQLGDILDALVELDIDVVSLEAARSGMALAAELKAADYQGGVGPGVYDVHAPGIPTAADIERLLRRAVEALGPDRVWVNPDCGLKTRRYEQVVPALEHMVAAAGKLRAELETG
ncbi:MAG TPA: 5-methyltetrahydropteroyltriglutamate--homocysteine S-methyltransferase [Acidimicrobiales bacterium]|nr:5-methyltetrahydropteroyltriglutamate--homocysteine S-methyltransferase [Acidimicrobiales bacterium]